jgi:hypothetical protein
MTDWFKMGLVVLITVAVMLSWVVEHEQEHRRVYETYGCEVIGTYFDWNSIAGVVPDCKSSIWTAQIDIQNSAIDAQSQFFGPILFFTVVLSYLLVDKW